MEATEAVLTKVSTSESAFKHPGTRPSRTGAARFELVTGPAIPSRRRIPQPPCPQPGHRPRAVRVTASPARHPGPARRTRPPSQAAGRAKAAGQRPAGRLPEAGRLPDHRPFHGPPMREGGGRGGGLAPPKSRASPPRHVGAETTKDAGRGLRLNGEHASGATGATGACIRCNRCDGSKRHHRHALSRTGCRSGA